MRKNINFQKNKAKMTPDAQPILQQVARVCIVMKDVCGKLGMKVRCWPTAREGPRPDGTAHRPGQIPSGFATLPTRPGQSVSIHISNHPYLCPSLARPPIQPKPNSPSAGLQEQT